MAVFTKVSTQWPRNFRPLPGDFGALFNTLSAAIGTGGSPALLGTATTTVFVGVPAARTWSVESAGMQGGTYADGSSTITAQLVKNPGASAVTMTAAASLTTSVMSSSCVDWPITATGANRTGVPGDTIAWLVVAAGTVGTAPVLQGVVEIAIQR
jgi:hypothetical protein